MYEQTFNGKHPGCLVILLDRSEAMGRPWRASGRTVADVAAGMVNELLDELCVQCTKDLGSGPRPWLEVGVCGYGSGPAGGGDDPSSVLGGELAGQQMLPITELAGHPLTIREAATVGGGGLGPVLVPVWVEPTYGTSRICEALARVGGYCFDWARAHPDSFPPVVLIITGGDPTGSRFEGAGLGEWARRLTGITTDDGAALLFTVVLSPDSATEVLFPATARELPAPGPALFAVSSPLPRSLLGRARGAGMPVEPGARAFGFNTAPAQVLRLFEFGSGRCGAFDA